MKSEFGKGCAYCLGLFLCHSERDYIVRDGFAKTKKEKECLEIINRPSMWFYGASDHMFEMEIPKNIPLRLQKRLGRFKTKAIKWRLPMDEKDNATEDDRKWAIQEAKDLLRELDKQLGLKPIKGGWE